ncbi:hypothetical protein B0T14DRAFT_565930 [Immersiella caudata]|uniref:Rhodopsin domain-containing protein n=1 Tax=Immersiella caudata TaxID=314043 RepID=A0AA39WPD1_9PEZI|nr:hypothetical protein B0T14DRAFT_565930 [Immersiella caudata]
MDGEVGKAPDLWIGYRTLAVLVPLFAVAVVFYTIRIWTRIRPKNRLNTADHTITVAFLSELLSMILTAVAVSRGFGRPAYLLSADDLEIIGICTFIVFVIGYWASTFARVSVALLLISITQQKLWRGILWAIIVFNMVFLVGINIFELFQCRPIRAVWAVVPDAKCFPPETVWNLGYAFVAVGIISDAVFAILPTILIWRLSRDPIEKALLSLLMGLGLVAVAAGVPKITTMQLYDTRSDNVVGDMMPCYLWTRIEEILLIIAACAPLLKVPLENMLSRKFGLPRFSPGVGRKLNSVYTIRPNSEKQQGYFVSWRARSWDYLKTKSSTSTTTTSTTSSDTPSPVSV